VIHSALNLRTDDATFCVQIVRLEADVIRKSVQPARIDVRSTFDPHNSHGLGALDAELLDDTLRDRFAR
jgi:hypothetical protein